jgi:hypothetical protein
MRFHGPIQISQAIFSDPGLYGRLLAEAPRTGRCPVLLSEYTLSRFQDDRHSAPVRAGVERHDAAAVPAVLRSWEDRFGAVLVRMHASTLDLAVAAPPWAEGDYLRVAAEHFAFTCDDDSPTPKTLSQYARRLRGARQWSFWWD